MSNDQAVAACHRIEAARWQAMLEELLGRLAGRFGRVELPTAGLGSSRWEVTDPRMGAPAPAERAAAVCLRHDSVPDRVPDQRRIYGAPTVRP